MPVCPQDPRGRGLPPYSRQPPKESRLEPKAPRAGLGQCQGEAQAPSVGFGGSRAQFSGG